VGTHRFSLCILVKVRGKRQKGKSEFFRLWPFALNLFY
jgi:hypothetical protein